MFLDLCNYFGSVEQKTKELQKMRFKSTTVIGTGGKSLK